MAYLVVNMKVTKVPAIGVGSGEGVLFVKAEKEPVFIVFSDGIWGPVGGSVLQGLSLAVFAKDVIDKVKHDHWAFDIGGEASVGTAAMEGRRVALFLNIPCIYCLMVGCQPQLRQEQSE